MAADPSRAPTPGSTRSGIVTWRPKQLHNHPPLTPAGVLLRHWFTLPLTIALFLFLAIAARINDGSMLRTWDGPTTRALEDLRSAGMDSAVKAVSSLGGIIVIVLVLCLLLLLVFHECRSLAFVLLAASAARPLLEWTLKVAVDRERPQLGQLVAGDGPSFPSGHVMAAVAIWGLLPPVLALVSGKHLVWWVSVAVSGTVIVLVAFSRVYLGVHWLSDVVGALLMGALYLLVVEWLFEWHHRRHPCRAVEMSFAAAEPQHADR